MSWLDHAAHLLLAETDELLSEVVARGEVRLSASEDGERIVGTFQAYGDATSTTVRDKDCHTVLAMLTYATKNGS